MTVESVEAIRVGSTTPGNYIASTPRNAMANGDAYEPRTVPNRPELGTTGATKLPPVNEKASMLSAASRASSREALNNAK